MKNPDFNIFKILALIMGALLWRGILDALAWGPTTTEMSEGAGVVAALAVALGVAVVAARWVFSPYWVRSEVLDSATFPRTKGLLPFLYRTKDETSGPH
jgi:hypothetical protein